MTSTEVPAARLAVSLDSSWKFYHPSKPNNPGAGLWSVKPGPVGFTLVLKGIIELTNGEKASRFCMTTSIDNVANMHPASVHLTCEVHPNDEW